MTNTHTKMWFGPKETYKMADFHESMQWKYMDLMANSVAGHEMKKKTKNILKWPLPLVPMYFHVIIVSILKVYFSKGNGKYREGYSRTS